ncbi:MAG: VOC family protein [Opitutaceae bacterium]|nr:VOC family protein [Opitutaceae bacterium]
MKFEHFALNVTDARAVAQWYVAHLGFTVAHQREDAPFTHFLADDTGRIIVEFYSNPAAPVPDYAAAHPLCFHLAVVAADAHAERVRLAAAGAKLLREEPQPDGSLLVMMRDPWGVPLQLCERSTPFKLP